MLTPSELNTTLKTHDGVLKVSINKLPDGTYQVDSTFFDKDGYYVAHKSSTRIATNIEDQSAEPGKGG